MELSKQKAEAYLDDLIVMIYLNEGSDRSFNEFETTLNRFNSDGYTLKHYYNILEDLREEYRQPKGI